MANKFSGDDDTGNEVLQRTFWETVSLQLQSRMELPTVNKVHWFIVLS